MNEMVDRVAKAIDAASTFGDGPRWRAELPALARAAIEAMRDPTIEMESAAAYYLGPALDVTQTWDAMIDAALKVTEPAE